MGNDNIPWSTPDEILDLKKEHVEAKEEKSEYRIYKSTMRLLSALVFSTQREDRQQGIDMLEASLINTNDDDDPSQEKQILYLLAVGYYGSKDYARSMHFVDRCLKIEPDFKVALSLKKNIEEQCALKETIEEQCVKESSWTGIGITVGGILAAGGIAAVCGTGLVGGMTAVVARRCLMFAAGGIAAAYGIRNANRMAASAALAHQNFYGINEFGKVNMFQFET